MVWLKDVIKCSNTSKNNYVKNRGIILDLEYDEYGGSILLAGGIKNDYFLLVSICKVCIANYKDFLATLRRGNIIEVSGIAGFTDTRDLNLESKVELYSPFAGPSSLPETIGMISIYPSNGIKEFVVNDEEYNHAGEIVKIYQKNGKNYLDINFMKYVVYEGSTTIPAYIYGENEEKGECKPPDPGATCVVDNDKTIKSYEVAEDVEFIPAGPPGLPVPYENLAEISRYNPSYRLKIKDNVIEKMYQIYSL